MYLTPIDVAAPPLACAVDIFFVLDASGSIGASNFILAKSFLKRLVGRLGISSGNTRVGVVTYATTVTFTRVINLNYAHSSLARLRSAITSLYYSGGLTNTDVALAFVRNTMMTSLAGDRSNVPNVVVVFSDGKSTKPTATRVCIKCIERVL